MISESPPDKGERKIKWATILAFKGVLRKFYSYF